MGNWPTQILVADKTIVFVGQAFEDYSNNNNNNNNNQDNVDVDATIYFIVLGYYSKAMESR